MTTTTDPALVRLSRRGWGALDTLHGVGYFTPEPAQAYVELGLDRRLAYFAARSAAFGPVRPEVTVATFYGFAPRLVGQALPSAWDIASPERVQQARRAGVSAALRRFLGEPDVSEALALARRVCQGLTAHGRPLYAAHAGLDWPHDDLMALWHAATLIREHRGDGHISVLHAAGLDPVESLVLGGLFSANTDFVRKTRGWTEEEWSAAEQRLQDRGLLLPQGGQPDEAAGGLTEDGKAMRQDIEQRTDQLAVEGWAAAGVEDSQRLAELVWPLREQILTNDEMPAWLSKRG